MRGSSKNTKKWTLETLTKEASKYKTLKEFYTLSRTAYFAACKYGLIRQVGKDLKRVKSDKVSRDIILKTALKFSTREEFKLAHPGMYHAVYRDGIIELAFGHMKTKNRWTKESLKKLTSQYKVLSEFRKKHQSAYSTIKQRKLLKELTGHMVRDTKTPYTFEQLAKEAQKYNSRVEFEKGSPSKYTIALNRGIMDRICKHMKKGRNVSGPERDLLKHIILRFKSAKTLKKRNISISNKPYIKGFDIDIFIPELNKGIEFDGDYWHSYKILKITKGRRNWPDEDIRNYHKIKDNYFKSIGIKILHIKEKNWLKDKNKELKRVWKFLGCQTEGERSGRK